MPKDQSDYIIIEKEYWKSPVRVFTGVTWMTFGFILGFLVGFWVLT